MTSPLTPSHGNKRKAWSDASAGEHLRLRGRALQRFRTAYLRDEPLCRHCAERKRVTAATEVDHIVPLAVWARENRKGDPYDRANLQPLCTPCHEAKSAKEQGRAAPPRGVDRDGWPL